jgi:hypothetical protein
MEMVREYPYQALLTLLELFETSISCAAAIHQVLCCYNLSIIYIYVHVVH